MPLDYAFTAHMGILTQPEAPGMVTFARNCNGSSCASPAPGAGDEIAPSARRGRQQMFNSAQPWIRRARIIKFFAIWSFRNEAAMLGVLSQKFAAKLKLSF
jgi:hypothetical protein